MAEVPAKNCTGCSLCAAVCPSSCITMQENDEGFLYPSIDKDACVECGKCSRTCPATNDLEDGSVSSAFCLACGKDRNFVQESSSGGMAHILSSSFLAESRRAVIGCSMDANGIVRHVAVKDGKDLRLLQGSKYVQSDLREIYKQCVDLLEGAYSLLVFGTPCQIIALKTYLNRWRDRVIYVDLICHGVPSQKFFSKDRDIQIQRGRLQKDVPTKFRLSSRYERTGFELYSPGCNGSIKAYRDAYYSLFLEGASFRESCYRCKYAQRNRFGDLTIGDCASADFYPNFHSDRPVSTVIINTSVGERMMKEIKGFIDIIAIDAARESHLNKQLESPSIRPNKRDTLYRDLSALPYEQFEKRYLKRPTFKTLVKERIKSVISVRARKEIKRIAFRVFKNEA